MTRPRSWVFLAVLFSLASVVETLGFGHFTAFTPLYLRQLGIGEEEVPRWTAYLSAASFVIGLPLAPFWGLWADRYSRKLIIVRSAYGEAVIFLLAGLSGNVWHLLLARAMAGLILGNTGVMFAILSSVAPKNRLALAIATVTAGSTVGISIGPVVGGLLVSRIGIGPVFLIDAALSVATGLALTLLLDEPPYRRSQRGTAQMLGDLGRALLASPVVLPLFGISALIQVGTYMSAPFLPLLTERLYQGPDLPTVIGIMLAGFGVASGVFTPIWGRLADRLGYGRVLLAAIAVVALALAAQGFAAGLAPLFATRFVQGLFQAAIGPAVIALIALATGEERRASVLNLALFPLYIGVMGGAGLAALLTAVAPDPVRAVFWAGAVAVAIALAWLVALRPRLAQIRPE